MKFSTTAGLLALLVAAKDSNVKAMDIEMALDAHAHSVPAAKNSNVKMALGTHAVVIIAKNSNIEAMNIEQIKRVFLGRQASIGGATTVVIYQSSGAVREAFDNQVLGKPGAQLTTYWSKLIFTGKARAPEEVETDAEVIAKVASTPGAIGYISDSAVNNSVKVLFNF